MTRIPPAGERNRRKAACVRGHEFTPSNTRVSRGRVERYGLTRGGEQYRGFTAIPASTTATMGGRTAAEVIARRANVSAATILASPTAARDAVRSARAKTHPDTTLGQTTDFVLVQEAARVLGTHHGVSL